MLKGRVVSTTGEAIEGVGVVCRKNHTGVLTQKNGVFQFNVPVSAREIEVSHVAYVSQKINIDPLLKSFLIIKMEPVDLEIDEVKVSSDRGESSMKSLEFTGIQMMNSSATGSLESMLKTQPGVQARNELSNQYTVRGGNFDENLLYINDIEIHKSLLYRSGKQEGLSSVNSQMVDGVQFSTGGFSACYGDKLSSVLSIHYKESDTTKTAVEGSILGANIHTQGKIKDKLSYNVGARYKTTNYLLSGSDEKGNYSPVFYDIQSLISYRLNQNISLDYLFFLSRNEYSFVPQTRETKFGTMNDPINFVIYYEGQEKDQFLNYTNALKFRYKFNDRMDFALIGSRWTNKERIRYDILGQYYLHKAGYDPSEPTQDVDNHAGVGSDMKHANEKVDITIDALQFKFKYFNEMHRFQVGGKIEKENIYEDSKRWTVYDSSGYFLPDDEKLVKVRQYYRMKQDLSSLRYQAYVSENLFFPVGNVDMALNIGARYQYWDYLNKGIFSPRTSISATFKNEKVLRFAWGVYQQMPFYKEFKSIDGTFYENIDPQKSVHYILGYSQPVNVWGRKMNISMEAYYKKLSNMIPYLVDNVYIQYLPEYQSKGYSKGFDVKFAGEFVPGVDSWMSLSLLKTEEDIDGDLYGYIPRPSDERLNFNLFFQDYFPGNKSLKMKLLFYLSSGLPFSAPQKIKTDQYFRMPTYKRVDIGFSKSLLVKRSSRWLDEAWLFVDIFNLFDMSNTISYYWITDIKSNQYAVPNHLTGRRFNIGVKFVF